MSKRSYPHWGGITSGYKVRGVCVVCSAKATRWGSIQHTWFRSDDELYALCQSNECRNELKRRENVAHCP